MEREYTIGGLLSLIIIFVIALIVFYTVPGFREEVLRIADDVFDITGKAEAERTELLKREDSKKLFENIKDCIKKFKEEKEKCTCSIGDKDLYEDYVIKPYLKEEEGHTFLRLEKGKVKVEGAEEESLEGLDFCILEEETEPKYVASFKLKGTKTGVPELEADGSVYKFIDDVPEFYNFVKDGRVHICFAVEGKGWFGSSVNEEDKKKIREFKDCSTRKNVAEGKMLDWFMNFVRKYERCKSHTGKAKCVCDSTNFKDLFEGYDILVTQTGKETTFSLQYKRDRIYKSIVSPSNPQKVENNIFGLNWDVLREKRFLKEWQGRGYTPVIFRENDEILYLNSNIAKPEEMRVCAPEYAYSICKGCEDAKPSDRTILEMIKRLKGEVRESDREKYTFRDRPYNEIIKEKIEDPYYQLLVAAIIPGESGFDRKAQNRNKDNTFDKGVMQFNDNTAAGFPEETQWNCGETSCYVCSQKEQGGCKEGDDNRFNSYISIPAAAQLLKENIKAFEKYTDKEIFALAAYNCGPTCVKNAIIKTDPDTKADPIWEDVMKNINPTTRCYPCRVQEYKKAFEPEFLGS